MHMREIDGQAFIKMITGGAANLKANAEIINDLNVFPIPDGDTGENMSMTIVGGLKHTEGYSEQSIDKAAEILADGMLMSARGNSGVILSQLFAGIAEGLRGKKTATVSDLADALKSGVKSAYAAVVNPTEGTILTVAREAIEYSGSRITPDSTLESFAEDYLNEMNASLNRTPELLTTLKEAGVIDSGGAGLYYIVDGIVRTFRGETIVLTGGNTTVPALTEFGQFNEDGVMEYGYCTEFLLQLQTAKIDIPDFSINELIEFLHTVGDSIVAFQNGTVVKVHVHTMTPGRILEYCQKYGEFLTLKIENMTLQHHETVIRNRFESAEKKEAKAFATITVATGNGIKNTFEELGADYVIDGGQGKNPSTEDFIKAFNTANAKTIFVLPNNRNILMAAKQAAELYTKSSVYVIESNNIGEGYAALTMLSCDSCDPLEIKDELYNAMVGVVTGMVTKSIRTANISGVEIHENDYIGFTDKTMLASATSKIDTACLLLEKLHIKEHEYLIVIYGADVNADEKTIFHERITKEYPHTELYEINGEQEVYDFLLILQ